MESNTPPADPGSDRRLGAFGTLAHDVVDAWSHAVRTPLHQVIGCLELIEPQCDEQGFDCATEARAAGQRLRVTLDELLDCLDALIGHSSRAQIWDVHGLTDEVSRLVIPLARERRVTLDWEKRSAGALTGRDYRRWSYLLRQTLTPLVRCLPGSSSLHVQLAAAASSRGCRWLQAEITTRVARPPGAEGESPAWGLAGDAAFGSVLADTALRVMDGACYRTPGPLGPVLRLVAPVEG